MLQIRLQPVSSLVMSESERQFILRAASVSDIRVDGRRTLESRALQAEVSTVGNTRSLSKVKLGATQVACVVSCELSQPYPDRPSEGAFQITTDYMHSAGTSAAASSGGAEFSVMEKAIQKAVDVESLCVVPGSKAWFVRCQLVVVDDCGAVADACSVAAMLALLHFRRPDCTVVGEDVTVYSVREKIPVPLTVQYVPLCISVAIFSSLLPDGDAAPTLATLFDPSDREEIVCGDTAGLFQVVLNAHQEVCGLHQGGAYMEVDHVMRLVDHAATIRADRGQVLQRALDASPFEVV